ncbi:hypothetical protein A3J41_03570 [candidate division TM6 bacterium RIFCSPHIGHO2_12_FULL_38_8]|nr:MAG: hypothetical protein A3J41_03570 [candidate division TM6 bacterium RIFCSPHIGHO2_12_FULL_38_8]
MKNKVLFLSMLMLFGSHASHAAFQRIASKLGLIATPIALIGTYQIQSRSKQNDIAISSTTMQIQKDMRDLDDETIYRYIPINKALLTDKTYQSANKNLARLYIAAARLSEQQPKNQAAKQLSKMAELLFVARHIIDPAENINSLSDLSRVELRYRETVLCARKKGETTYSCISRDILKTLQKLSEEAEALENANNKNK